MHPRTKIEWEPKYKGVRFSDEGLSFSARLISLCFACISGILSHHWSKRRISISLAVLGLDGVNLMKKVFYVRFVLGLIFLGLDVPFNYKYIIDRYIAHPMAKRKILD